MLKIPSPRWKEYCRCTGNCGTNICGCRKRALACTKDCACKPRCKNGTKKEATADPQPDSDLEKMFKKNEEDLKKQLQQSEELCRNLSHSLKEIQDMLNEAGMVLQNKTN